MSHPAQAAPTAAKPGPIQPPTADQVKAAAAASGPQPAGPSVPLPPASPASATPDLCGQPHSYKTKTGETKTKPCVKARGHEGLHSSRQQGPKVDLTVIAGATFSAEEVPTDELLDIVTERVRSAEQLRVDADVALAHRKWTQTGKKLGFNEAIRAGGASRYLVPPEHVAAVRTLLRRAENAPELKGKVHVKIAPPKTHTSGAKMLYFVVVDKKKAEPTAAASHTAASTGTAPVAGTPAASTPDPKTGKK